MLSLLHFQHEENVGPMCFCLLGKTDIFSEVSATKQNMINLIKWPPPPPPPWPSKK